VAPWYLSGPDRQSACQPAKMCTLMVEGSGAAQPRGPVGETVPAPLAARAGQGACSVPAASDRPIRGTNRDERWSQTATGPAADADAWRPCVPVFAYRARHARRQRRRAAVSAEPAERQENKPQDESPASSPAPRPAEDSPKPAYKPLPIDDETANDKSGPDD
jgi:hypothetical protein